MIRRALIAGLGLAMVAGTAVGQSTAEQKAQAETRAQQAREEAARAREYAEAVRAQAQDVRARLAPLADGQVQILRAAADGKMEKVAFLGVTASPVSPAMREQLKLQRGIGLVVELVEKDGPADKAGLKQHDIIEKLNDQWIVNQQQLGVLVRLNKPGDTVKLTVVRQGERMQLDATLAEKEMFVSDEQDMIAVARAGMPLIEFAPVEKLLDEKVWMGKDGDFLKAVPGAFQFELAGGAEIVMVMKDDEHTLHLTTKDGATTLKVTDAQDKVIFEGPVDTEEQKQALPDEIKAKFEKLEQGRAKVHIRARKP